jgi:hypothetical protein
MKRSRFTCLACDLPVDEREPWVRVVDGRKLLGAYHALCYDILNADTGAKVDFQFALERLERMRRRKEGQPRSSLG